MLHCVPNGLRALAEKAEAPNRTSTLGSGLWINKRYTTLSLSRLES